MSSEYLESDLFSSPNIKVSEMNGEVKIHTPWFEIVLERGNIDMGKVAKTVML